MTKNELYSHANEHVRSEARKFMLIKDTDELDTYNGTTQQK